jgi:hypothetical protein
MLNERELDMLDDNELGKLLGKPVGRWRQTKTIIVRFPITNIVSVQR